MLISLALAASAQSSGVALDLLKILAAAALVAVLLRRFRLPLIPCYLITGALIGPGALGLVESGENISSITGLAMVMLLFTIGLHLDPSSIGSGVVRSLAVGIGSTLGVVLVFWAPAAHLGGSWSSGLAIAMAVSMSSTAVVLQILQQQREMQKINGRLCVAISITQDLLSLAFMASIPVLAKVMGDAVAAAPVGDAAMDAAHGPLMFPPEWPVWLTAIAGLVGIAGLIVAGRRLMPLALKEASRGGISELPLVIAAAGALIAATVAAGLGFSPELGAFLAGFLLAATPFRHQLAGQLSPMRDLFMAVFFTAVGLKLNIGAVASDLHLVVIGVVMVVLFKTLLIAGLSWVAGASAPVSLLVGLTLSQAGEFTIVVMTAGTQAGLIGPRAESVLIAIVVLTLAITPALYALGKKLGPLASRLGPCRVLAPGALREPVPIQPERAAASEGEAADGDAGAPTVAPKRQRYALIAGFGVVGRSLADQLDVAGIRFCVVDMNQRTIETQRKLGRAAVYGDISNPEVLESAGLEHADAVLLTIPDDEATLRACTVIRNARPDIFIAARTGFLSKAFVAQQLGADHVVVEEVATAEMMARQVMARLRDAKLTDESSKP